MTPDDIELHRHIVQKTAELAEFGDRMTTRQPPTVDEMRRLGRRLMGLGAALCDRARAESPVTQQCSPVVNLCDWLSGARQRTGELVGGMAEPMAKALAAVGRWRQLADRRIAGGMPPAEAERRARIRLAAERRAKWPRLRTWAPGDPEPEMRPSWGVYDIDGTVWLCKPDGLMHLHSAERRRFADVRITVEEPLTWAELLERYGPATERRAPRTQWLP